MASSSSLRISITLHCATSSKETGNSRSNLTNCFLPRIAGLAFSTRRRGTPSATSKKISKKKSAKKNVGEDEDVDEDAFDGLFRQLEQDLKNNELNGDDDDDDDISEEDLAKLEQELVEALGVDDELLGALGLAVREEIENEDDANEEDEYEDDDNEEDEVEEEEEEEEEEPIKLKNWQLKRLADALKDGRRKTNINNLAADLCLDRAIVLKLLRDPPPNLVMLSATLPDKPPSTTILNPVEAFSLESVTDNEKPEEVKEKVPVHVMQSNWSARKRLKKVQVDTLEEVYKRTKRPINTMVSSIVHVTNLPRKKVVKWFEDKIHPFASSFSDNYGSSVCRFAVITLFQLKVVTIANSVISFFLL